MSGGRPAPTSEYLHQAQTPTPGPTPTTGGFLTPTLDTAQLCQSYLPEASDSWTPTAIANASRPDPSLHPQSPHTPGLHSQEFSKKPGQETQLPSPPNTNPRGAGDIAPTLNMQDDQNFGQPAFLVTSQAQGMDVLLEGNGDMFDYPMSAPVTGPDSFWDDTGMSFNMDMSFVDTSAIDWSQPMTPSHRPSGSFDYNNEVNLFAPPQPSQPSQPVLSPTQPEPVRPVPVQRRERVLAPKPPVVDTSSTTRSSTNPKIAAYHPNLVEPFSATNPGGRTASFAGRPQTSTGDMSFQFSNESGLVQGSASDIGNQSAKNGSRRSSSNRGAKNGKLPDRASASSPIKAASGRPGLGRSFSESRGRKSVVRSKMTGQPAGPRANGLNMVAGQVALPSGRLSPVKALAQPSTLRPIPEMVPRRAPAANVEFLIVNGRAEARLVNSPTKVDAGSASYSGESSDDSSDDEPIQLPTQRPSRNTSFALPDPLKPVGSIFDAMDDQDDVESEAETVMNENHGEKSDATSEIHRVLEKQRQLKKANGGGAQSFQRKGRNGLYRDTASPDSLEGSGLGGRAIRCVCARTGAEKDAGYLIKCDYCEYWLHGECVNIDQPSRPQIYVCRVCAMGGGRVQDNRAAYSAAAGSPLANKSFKGLR